MAHIIALLNHTTALWKIENIYGAVFKHKIAIQISVYPFSMIS